MGVKDGIEGEGQDDNVREGSEVMRRVVGLSDQIRLCEK